MRHKFKFDDDDLLWIVLSALCSFQILDSFYTLLGLEENEDTLARLAQASVNRKPLGCAWK